MIDVDAISREKMWKILCFLDISDTSKSSSSSLVLLHGSCGIAIRICSTSETVLRASIVLCSTCLENSIDYGYQYQCYHPGDYITSGSRSDQKDLLVCLTFVYPIIPEYPIQIWTLQVITMLSIRWTTHMIHIEAPAKIITLIWLHCVPENHNSCTRNAVMGVLNHRPAVVETKYVYLYTPNDISKIMILTPTILHEPTPHHLLHSECPPRGGTKMTHFQQEKSGTNYKVNPSSSTPHSDNNYTQSIASPQSLNHSLTSNIHCRWCW